MDIVVFCSVWRGWTTHGTSSSGKFPLEKSLDGESEDVSPIVSDYEYVQTID